MPLNLSWCNLFFLYNYCIIYRSETHPWTTDEGLKTNEHELNVCVCVWPGHTGLNLSCKNISIWLYVRLPEKEQKKLFFSVQSLENSLCAERERVGLLRAELKGLSKAQSWWQGWGGLILTDCCGDTEWNCTGHRERPRTAALCFVTEQCWTLQTHTQMGLQKAFQWVPLHTALTE